MIGLKKHGIVTHREEHKGLIFVEEEKKSYYFEDMHRCRDGTTPEKTEVGCAVYFITVDGGSAEYVSWKPL